MSSISSSSAETTNYTSPFDGKCQLTPKRHFKATDQGLIEFAEKYPDSKKISWCDTLAISDKGLIAFAEKCRSIQTICLGWSTKITAQGIIKMAEKYPDLQAISLAGYCFEITDDALAALAKRCQALQAICLAKCSRITQQGLITFVKNYPDLQMIDISGCALNDASLGALAEKCQALKIIHLKWCNEITNKGVIALTETCPNLQEISLSCKKVTNRGISELAQNCRRLTKIHLVDFENRIDPALKNLVKKCTALRKVHLTSRFFINIELKAMAENFNNFHCEHMFGNNRSPFGSIILAHK